MGCKGAKQTRIRELAKTKLDFGRYKGATLSQVPHSYLNWLVAECHDVTYRWLVAEYLKLRDAARNYPASRKRRRAASKKRRLAASTPTQSENRAD